MESVDRKRISHFSGKGRVKNISLWKNAFGKTVILMPEKNPVLFIDSLEKVFLNKLNKGIEIPYIFLEKIGVRKLIKFDLEVLFLNGQILSEKENGEIGLFDSEKALAISLGFLTCHACKQYTKGEKRINDKITCQNCEKQFADCVKCGINSFRPNRAVGLDGVFCSKCFDHLFQCRDCDQYHDEKTQCQRSKRQLTNIMSYGFHPPIFYKGKASGSKFPIYAGMEYEIVTPAPESTLAFYRETYGDLFWGVRDSSVEGVELISQPMTLEGWHNLNLKVHPSACLDGAGIHIHVDRDPHTSDQVRGIIDFLWENKNFVIKTAERLTHYAKFIEPSFYSKEEDLNTYKGGEKYSALNFLHANTLEYRIFKTTNKAENILKNIEFCFSLFGWTKSGSTGKATLADYLAYVKSEKTTFNNLGAFLEKEKICA